MKILNQNKPCKLCNEGKRLPGRTICYKCHLAKEREKKLERLERKVERKKNTKKYKETLKTKAMKLADKAFQEWGRRTYHKCAICGGEYSCLHHFVLKAQSLFLRYKAENGVPICAKCHCKIHVAQDSVIILQAKIAMIKLFGQDWESYIIKNRYKFHDKTIEYFESNIKIYE